MSWKPITVDRFIYRVYPEYYIYRYEVLVFGYRTSIIWHRKKFF